MTSDELIAAVIEDHAATAGCDHRDAYGSTVMPDGLCIICSRTPRPRRIAVAINGTVLSTASLTRALRRLTIRAPGPA